MTLLPIHAKCLICWTMNYLRSLGWNTWLKLCQLCPIDTSLHVTKVLLCSRVPHIMQRVATAQGLIGARLTTGHWLRFGRHTIWPLIWNLESKDVFSVLDHSSLLQSLPQDKVPLVMKAAMLKLAFLRRLHVILDRQLLLTASRQDKEEHERQKLLF